MTILASTLMILSICGCWRPPSWSFSYYKRFMYNLYNICVIFLVSSLSLSQIIGIALNISSDLSEEIYISLTIAVSCLKMLTFKFNHNDVVKLINTLAEEPYKPSDNEEIQIQLKFEKLARLVIRIIIQFLVMYSCSFYIGHHISFDFYQNILLFILSRLNTNGYTSLIGFSVSSFVFMSLITDLKEKQLTFQVWLPFDSTTPVIYYLTYTQQMLGMTLAGFLNVALDSLICGIFIHICCQIKILENRLIKISNEQEALLKLCVRHHECIYKLVHVRCFIKNSFEN